MVMVLSELLDVDMYIVIGGPNHPHPVGFKLPTSTNSY